MARWLNNTLFNTRFLKHHKSPNKGDKFCEGLSFMSIKLSSSRWADRREWSIFTMNYCDMYLASWYRVLTWNEYMYFMHSKLTHCPLGDVTVLSNRQRSHTTWGLITQLQILIYIFKTISFWCQDKISTIHKYKILNSFISRISSTHSLNLYRLWPRDSSWWRHQMETFVRGIHRSPVNSPHKGQWRGALMFTLICARINGWVNNREAGDLRRYRPHYDVIVMLVEKSWAI